MKKLLLTLSIALAALSVKSQTYHGIGAHFGFDKNKFQNKFVSLEYEANKLKIGTSGLYHGFVLGAGGTIQASGENELGEKGYNIYAKIGYKIDFFSAGINLGAGNQDTNIGGWVSANVSRTVKLQVGYNSFSNINIGLVVFPFISK